MSLPRPTPSEVRNGHRLFVAAIVIGNAGVAATGYTAFCSCHYIGRQSEDEGEVRRLWREHADEAPA